MSIFDMTSGLRPGHSVFDLSYQKKFSADMGKLIPIVADEAVPGDRWKIGNEIVIRFNAMLAPIMHEVNAYVHYFFVPYRLLDSNWEGFITGGIDGQNAYVLPRWDPTGANGIGSLWDYMGFPTDVVPTGCLPIDYVKRAYNLIYNQYYRDETLENEIDINNTQVVQTRAWEKDYFTSALPWQQRGIAPALPIVGATSAVWPDSAFAAAAPNSPMPVQVENANTLDKRIFANGTNARPNLRDMFNNNTVSPAGTWSFNVADIRLVFQIQKWMERNARSGARYTEYLRSHFGVAPRDERLQRAEYIGGTRAPVVVSEVLQTAPASGGSTPLATMGGHGLSASRGFAASYRVEEFGIILGIMSVMPRSSYQQGVDRQWLRRSRYDFYSPEFANLSEQAIERGELYATAVEAENRTVFGFQGRYDELRVKRNMVCGLFRTDFKFWHLGRIFSSAPLLNSTFIKSTDIRKDIFAVPSQPAMMVHVGNNIQALRPLPYASNPGLIDHS